jgi:hypothetical protein
VVAFVRLVVREAADRVLLVFFPLAMVPCDRPRAGRPPAARQGVSPSPAALAQTGDVRISDGSTKNNVGPCVRKRAGGSLGILRIYSGLN